MERDIDFGGTSPGPFRRLVEVFVEDIRTEAAGQNNIARCQGALYGADLCEQMKDGEVVDFELQAIIMAEIDKKNETGFHAREVPHDFYKAHQVAKGITAQCYDMLRLAHSVEYGRLYGEAAAWFTGDKRHDPTHVHESTVELYRDLAERAGG